MGKTGHTRAEIEEIAGALIALHNELGSEQLEQLGIANVAEILLEQGDRPAGSWIFANRSAWNDFVRTGELVMKELESEKPKPEGSPPKRVA